MNEIGATLVVASIVVASSVNAKVCSGNGVSAGHLCACEAGWVGKECGLSISAVDAAAVLNVFGGSVVDMAVVARIAPSTSAKLSSALVPQTLADALLFHGYTESLARSKLGVASLRNVTVSSMGCLEKPQGV